MAEKLDGWLANEKSCAILMKVKNGMTNGIQLVWRNRKEILYDEDERKCYGGTVRRTDSGDKFQFGWSL